MKRLVQISVYLLVSLSFIGCQTYTLLDDKPLSLNSRVFISQKETRTGTGLLVALDQQKEIQNKTLKLLEKQDEILCDYAVIRSGAYYGLNYLVPIRNKKTNQINKALVYKIIDESEQHKEKFKPTIYDVVVLDEQEMNRIPINKRFLQSYPFKKWEEEGLKVSAGLTDFAKKLHNKRYNVNNRYMSGGSSEDFKNKTKEKQNH